MARNSSFQHIFILFVFVLSVFSATALVNVDKCGHLDTIQPTILGRNVTFTFIPSWYDTNATFLWQRASRANPWSTLPREYKFSQFEENETFYLIVTDTKSWNDEVYYRAQYYNKTVNCTMESEKLKLHDITGEKCGFVYLRTARIEYGEKVEIEYYPTNTVINNPDDYVRKWVRSVNNVTTNLTNYGSSEYEENLGLNKKYVFTIFSYDSSMDGNYSVRCKSGDFFSNSVNLVLPVAPSTPIIDGLKDIDKCNNCFVGEAAVQFQVFCRFFGGTEPFTVTMAIGNKSLTVTPNRNTGGYKASFGLKDGHHMATIKCSVKNDALTSPLTVSAPVYIIKPPREESFGVPEVLKEGDPVNITCTFASGRPAPTLSFNISNTELLPAHQNDTFNNTNQLYNSVIALHTFKRKWNSQTISCCRHSDWYKEKTKCVTREGIKYLFPPSRVEIQIQGENGASEVYAVCTIYNMNPVCKAKWQAPAGSFHSERSSRNLSDSFGAWISEYKVKVNMSHRYHGDKIICAPECHEFTVATEKSVYLPFSPVLEFNISSSVLEIPKGSEIYVKCTARSSPKANIYWIEHSATGNLTLMELKQCPNDTECIIALKGDRLMQRNISCNSENFVGQSSKTFTLKVIEIKGSEKEVDSIYWILGSVLAVIAIIVLIGVVLRRKMKNKKANMAAMGNPAKDKSRHNHEMNCEQHLDPNINHDVGEASAPSGSMFGGINNVSGEMSCENVTYAVVNKTAQAHAVGKSTSESPVKAGQLIYADLDFVYPDCNPIKRTVVNRRCSPTEYVGIDFIKTAKESSRGEETDDIENVYANQ